MPITSVSPLVQVGSSDLNNYVKGAPLTFEEGFLQIIGAPDFWRMDVGKPFCLELPWSTFLIQICPDVLLHLTSIVASSSSSSSALVGASSLLHALCSAHPFSCSDYIPTST